MKSCSSLHELKQIVSAKFVFIGKEKVRETVTGKNIIILVITMIQYYRQIMKGLVRNHRRFIKHSVLGDEENLLLLSCPLLPEAMKW